MTKNKLRHLLGHFLSLRGHSLILFLVMAAIFAVAGLVPHGLAWTLRVFGFLLLGLSVWRALEDLPRVTDWLASKQRSWYHDLCRWAGARHRGILRWEILLAVVVILPAAAHFGQNAFAMAKAPLRVDEIGSVRAYTARGPFVSAATYNLAKNHIFFSVLNSLTPGSGSLNPVRARFWSFVTVMAALVLLAAFFWKLGSPLAGAVAFAIPALNSEHLTKVFEARGYGLLTLMATVGLMALYAYLRHRKTWSLWVLAISVVLGTWTLPFYIVFGGALLLLLYLMQPCRATFLAGFGALLAILAVYSLVITSVFQVAAGYDEKYGEIFTSLESVFKAMALAVPASLLRMDGVSFLVIGLVILALPLVLRGTRPEASQSLLVATGLIVGFYLFCLVLASPPVRITAFLAMPVAFVGGMIVLQILTFPGLAILRPVLGIFLAVIFLVGGKSSLAAFDFQPDQRWEDVAKVIHMVSPGGTRIAARNYGKYLSAYLGKDYEIEKEMPAETDLLSGKVLLFDPAHKSDHKTLAVERLYPTVVFAEVRFPVRKGLHQVLYIPLPGQFPVPTIRGDAGNLTLPASIARGETLQIEIPPTPLFRGICFVFDSHVSPTAPAILPKNFPGPHRVAKMANVVVVTFDEPLTSSSVDFQVDPKAPEVILQAVWMSP